MSDKDMSAADIAEVCRRLGLDVSVDGKTIKLFDSIWVYEQEHGTQKLARALERLQLKPKDNPVATIDRPVDFLAGIAPAVRVSSLIARRAGEVIEVVRELDKEQRDAVFNFAQFALGEEEMEDELRKAAAEARGRGRA